MDPSLNENLITTKDAGEISGYTSDYLSSLLRSGKIAGKRIGRNWLVDRKSLANFLDTQGNRNADRARTLASDRSKEYRAHRSFLHRATKALTAPSTASRQFGIAETSLLSHAAALAVSFLVVVSGSLVAHSEAIPKLAAGTAAIANDVLYGFNETFGDIPQHIAENISSANSVMRAQHERVAEQILYSSSGIYPLALDLPSAQILPSENAPMSHSFASASAPVERTNVTVLFVDGLRSSVSTAYAMLTSPPLIANALTDAYTSLGVSAYAAIHASLDTYRKLIEQTGTNALVLASATRDILAYTPRLVAQTNLAFGEFIIEATHAAIRADASLAYVPATAAPAASALALRSFGEAGRTTVALIGSIGDSVVTATERIAVETPAHASRVLHSMSEAVPSLAQVAFDAEYSAADRFVSLANGISYGYLSFLTGSGQLAYEGGKSVRDSIGGMLPNRSGLSKTVENAYLGMLGKIALALENQASRHPMLAAVASGLSSAEQFALGTYETIHSFFDNTSRTLATLFTPIPTIVMPGGVTPPRSITVATSTSLRIANSYPTYTTIVQGVSAEAVSQSLDTLRTNILGTVAGMIQPVSSQVATNSNTIQYVNMIQDLSNLIVRNGDFRGGTFDNGIRVSATGGNFTNLSGGATTLGATTVSGGLTVDGVAITGSSAGNVATSSSETAGNLPYWTSTAGTPAALGSAANLNWDNTNSLLTVTGNASTTNLSVFRNAWFGGTATSTFTNQGWLGIGTSTPSVNLSVQGNGLFSGNLSVANLTATGTAIIGSLAGVVGANNGTLYAVASSSFFGFTPISNALAKGYFLVGDDAGVAQATSSIFISSTGNVGIGTTSPYSMLSVVGQIVGQNYIATSTTATSTFSGGLSVGNNAAFVVNQAATANSLYINNAGNVGIATTSPYSLLSIGGNVVIGASTAGGTLGTLTLPALGTAAGTLLAADTTGKLISTSTIGVANLALAKGNFLVGDDAGVAQATSSIFISSTGNVGIGTTSVGSKFVVSGGTVVTGGDDFTSLPSGVGGNNSGVYTGFSGTHGYISAVNPAVAGMELDILGYPTKFLSSQSGSELMRIDITGNVGIGTTSPTQALSVQGNGLFSGNVTMANLTATGTAVIGSLAGVVGANNGTLYAVASSSLFGFTPISNALTKGYFLVGNDAGVAQATSSIFISSTGNVGIGTTTPSTNLSVQGNGLFSGNIAMANLTATGTAIIGSLAGVVGANNGTLYAVASSSLFGFTPASSATTITTAYPLTGGGDLSGNRTFALDFGTTTANSWSQPQQFIGSASTTNLSASSNLWVGGNATTTSSGNFTTNGTVGIGTTSPSTTLGVVGNGYFTGGFGVGLVNTSAGTLKTTGTATVGSDLFLQTLLNCSFASSAIQTDGSGKLVCGVVTAIGGTSAGGWTWLSPGYIKLASSTDLVGVGVTPGASSAKLTINSGGVATTTLSLNAVTSQTANILEVYDNALNLSSVISPTGKFGIGTSTPYSKLTTWGTGSLFEAVTNASTTVFSIGQGGATSTAFFATTASSTNLFSANATAGTLNVTGQTTLATSLSGLLAGSSGVVYSTATSSLAIGSSLSNSGTLGSQIGGTASSLSLNMGNANSWTALQSFLNASTTLFSNTGTAYFGATATSTFSSNGSLTLPTVALLTAPYASTTMLTATTASTTNLIASAAVTFQNLIGMLSSNGTSGVSARTLTGTTNQITVANGDGTGGNPTFSLPSTLSFTDATSTNFFASRLTANTFAAGGTASTTIDSSGNLATAGTLNVTGQTTLATSLSGLLQGASGVVSAIGGTAGQFPYYNGTNTLLATSSIFLATSGNVGIGTTSPYSLLSIGGNVVIGASTAGGTLGTLTLPALGTAAGTLLAADTTGKLISTSTIGVANLALAKGNFLVGNDAGVAQATSSIFISSTGNVGIGTTSPSTKFSVGGAAGDITGHGYFTGGLGVGVVNTVAGTMQTSGAVTIGGALTVNGLCVAADTRLRRRRKARKGEEDEADEEGYIYDEVMIKDVEEGDEIQSLDEKTGKLVWSRVKQLAFMGKKQTYKLVTASGKTIRTTANHPYLARKAKNQIASRTYAFIDLANVFRGAESEGWNVDYEKLQRYLATRYGVTRAFVFGGTSNRPDRVELHEQLVRLGYEVLLVPTRNFKDGTSKADVDSRMTFEMMRVEGEYDRAVVFTGDGDFYWVLEYLRATKKHVWLFGMAKRTARDLKRMFLGDFSDMTLLRGVLSVGEETQKAEITRISASPVTYTFDGYATGVRTSYQNRSGSSSTVKSSVDNSVRSGEGSWLKVAELKEGMEIAVAAPLRGAVWDRVVSVEPVGEEDVYDIEVEGTHNFIGNDIVAHNTAIFNNASTTQLSVTNRAYFGGTATSTFDSAGNLSVAGTLGVGTTSPYSLLSISNSAGTAANTPLFTIASTTGGTSTSTLMTVLANGNVGIGTNSPTGALTIGSGQILIPNGTVAAPSIGNTTNPSSGIYFANVSASRADTTITNNGTFVFMARPTQILVAAGTATTLGLTDVSFAQMGLFWPAQHTLGFGDSVIGEMARFTSTGNLGIGTTTPYSRLSVWGAGTGATSLFELTNSASTTLASVLNDGTFYMKGNVGIGTTSPSAPLHISYGSANSITTTPALIIDNPAGGAHTAIDLRIANVAQAIIRANSAGSLLLGAKTSGHIILGTNDLGTWTGNVGIGTTTPYSKLTTWGTGSLFEAVTNASTTVFSIGQGGATSTAFFATTASSTNLFSQTASLGTLNLSGLATFTNGFLSLASSTITSGLFSMNGGASTTALSISGNTYFPGSGIWNSSGNVGIGTTSPMAAFSLGSGQIVVPNGSASVPSYSFASQPSTGLYFPGANTLSVTTAGTERARFVVNGLEMIPLGSASAPSITWNSLQDTGLFAASGVLGITAGGTERMRINSSGNVGVGTTTPLARLDIAGTLGSQIDLFNVSSTTATNVTSSLFRIGANGNVGIGSTTPWGLLSVNGNALGAGVPQFVVGSSTATNFVVAQSGFVGIGTSSPTYNFTVNQGTSTSPSNAIAAFTGSGGLGTWKTSTSLVTGVLTHTSVVANGYVYVIGGNVGGTAQTGVQYAKLNSDGSVGSWATTTPLATAEFTHSSVVANGYVYAIGGNSSGNAVVQYAKLNANGTLGSWQTTTPLGTGEKQHASVVANGFVYTIGGNGGNVINTTVQYARLNADGSVGAWQTASSLPTTGEDNLAAVVANGYVYALGGFDGTVATTTVSYAKLNADGSLGSWAITTPLAMAEQLHTAAVANGYVYVLGGSSNQTTVQYAPLNADGTIGTWQAATALNTGQDSAASVVANGYVYVLGGNSTTHKVVQYAPLQRVMINGNLDLLGLAGGSLNDANTSGSGGSTGGSIFAGNIFSNGTLEVTGNAMLQNSLGVNGNFTMNATSSLSQNASIFSLNNATGTSPILTALYNGNVGIGTSTPAYKLDVAGAINTDQYSGYYQAGQLLAYASSTNQSTLFGLGAGGQNATTSATAAYNTAIGYQALSSNTTGTWNTAIGVQALYTNSTGYSNTANGMKALYFNTIGYQNTANGYISLYNNTTGNFNIANGYAALRYNSTGSNNVANGAYSLYNNASATSSVALGYAAAWGAANYSNQGGVYVGYQSGYSAATGSDYNTLLGYQSGYGVTTGSNNIWLGSATSSTAIANLTTGSQNILIGNNISLPSATASGQLNIGNIIFGTGITGTGSTLSTGNVGIGTTSPGSKLEVNGSVTVANNNTIQWRNSSGSTEGVLFLDSSNYTVLNNISQSILFKIAGDEKFRLDNSGNVGIGTTSPVSKLSVLGESAFAGGASVGIGYAGTAAPSNGLIIQGNVGIGTTSPWGLLSINPNGIAGPSFVIGSSTATNFIVTNGGNVGIGTTTPNWLLQVAGTRPSFALTDTSAALNNKHWLFSSMGGNLYIGTSTDVYATSTPSALTILNNGMLGIGTTTPYAMLSVAGLAAAGYYNADNAAATSTFAGGFTVGSGALSYDFGANKTWIERLNTGPLSFEADSGVLSWIDMPVTSASAASTSVGYSAQLNGNQMLSIWGESDGNGDIMKTRVVVGTSTDATLDSANIPYGSLIISDGALCVDNAAGASCAGTALTRGQLYAKSITVGQVDLAENFPTEDATLEAGEIVAADPMNSLEVVRYDATATSSTPLGIVSTAPGFLLGVGKKNGPAVVPIALAGRVPLKVSLKNGPIKQGDYLAPSPDIPGYGVKALTSGMMIGIALESTDASATSTDTATITTFVRPQYAFIGNGSAFTINIEGGVLSGDTSEFSTDTFFDSLTTASTSSATTSSSAVLTADGKSLDLYKLATFALHSAQTFADKISKQDVRLTSLEDRVAKLESGAVSSESASPITLGTSTLASALESFGVLIQKGIAQFNTLVFRQLVASKDENGTSSAGSVTITAGNTVAQINNSLVLPSTKIFITFNSSVAGSWWVNDKNVGSFRVVLSAPQAADVSFDYFLVQTDGQLATSSPEVAGSSFAPSVTQSNGELDRTPPVFALLGDNPVHVSVGGTYVEPGVTVSDNVDPSTAFGAGGPLAYTVFVNGIQQDASSTAIDTANPITHIITYSATDHAGNLATITRAVVVGEGGAVTSSEQQTGAGDGSSDTTAPIIMLNGDAAMQFSEGQTFTDPGATATDDVDGDLTANIKETVTASHGSQTSLGSLTSMAGSYTLTYSATDAAGNEAHVSRFVTVTAPAAASDAAATSTSSI